MILLRASWVLPVSRPPIRDGCVAVADDGNVAWVGSATSRDRPSGEERDLGGALLLPGLVNAHCHLELSHLAERVDRSRGFVPWVESLVAERGRSDPAAARDAAAAAVARLEACGTAAVGDVSNVLAHLDLLAQSRVSAVVFFELIGWDPARADAVMEHAERQLAECQAVVRGSRVKLALAAHAPHSVSAALFRCLVDRGGPAALHLAESPAESRFLASGNGEWAEFLARRVGDVAFAPPAISPVVYVDALGALRRGMVAAHCVQTDAHDRKLLAEAGVAVAVCPRSNRNLDCGLAPVPELLEAGVAVCLGTDSLASVATLDVLDDAVALHREFPELPAERVLQMATVAGAAALGFEDLGTLEAGKRAALAWGGFEAATGDPVAFLLSGEARLKRVEL